MKCKVCGRKKEQLEEEFGIEIEMKEHQGMQKCSKCVEEYERELGGDEDAVNNDSSGEGDWKARVTA